MRVTGLGAETARLNTLGGQWCVCLIRIAPSPGGVSATACPGGGSRHRPIRLDPRSLGGGVLDEDVVVVVDEVVVVVEVVESEAEERAAGDGGGSRASGAGV